MAGFPTWDEFVGNQLRDLFPRNRQGERAWRSACRRVRHG